MPTQEEMDEAAFVRAHHERYWGERVAERDSLQSVRVDGVQYVLTEENSLMAQLGFRGHGRAGFLHPVR